MEIMAVHLFIALLLFVVVEMLPVVPEPSCNSRYDYDAKLMENSIRTQLMLETYVEDLGKYRSEMAAGIKAVNQALGEMKDNTNRKIDVMQAELGTTNTQLAAKIEAVNHNLDQMKENTEQLKENTTKVYEIADKKFNQMQEQMENMVSDIKELKDSDINPGVIFHAKTINAQPTAGSIIKFSTIVENTDDVYSITTGCFTAPRNGIYWFSAHVCTKTGKRFSPSTFVGKTLIVRTFNYYKDDEDCSTISAVARLQLNDLVCPKAGPNSYSSAVWTDYESWK